MRKTGLWLLLIGLLHGARAQVPYPLTPDWRSADRFYATGGVFADLNNDGWLDFVVSNGNDMRRERVAVYYNQGGVLETTPSWTSNDIAYHGHLAVGDVNQDGWLDVAVAILLPQGGPGVKLYLNQNGQLSPTPNWTSAVSFYGWYPSFGDPDGDGDLDLVIGGLWPYSGSGRQELFIFFNHNGVLERNPSWQVTDVLDAAHPMFADVDHDGDQDLMVIARNGNRLYRNHNGVISTTPDWISTDNNLQFANTMAIGELTGDGWFDMVMSDNNQISGGCGCFKLYQGVAPGTFTPNPVWSYYDGYVSGVALADIDGDGRLDLAVGKWWGPVRIFLNTGTGFGAVPDWTSSVSLVVEAITFGDLNRDGIRVRTEQFQGDGVRKLFSLAHRPLHRLLRVLADGEPLPLSAYCYQLTEGWLSLAQPPQESLVVEYEYSPLLEMGVTDWQRNGNIVFYHRSFVGDIVRNGCVDDADLLTLLFDFGQEGALPSDLDRNGRVDDSDLLLLLFHFGRGCN